MHYTTSRLGSKARPARKADNLAAVCEHMHSLPLTGIALLCRHSSVVSVSCMKTGYTEHEVETAVTVVEPLTTLATVTPRV
jgi:hypothetical protein